MQQTERTTLVAMLLAFLAACSFDSSAFDARPACSSDDDCLSGVCFEGSCTPRELLVDADESDVAADAERDTTPADVAEDSDDDTGPDVLDDAGSDADATNDADAADATEDADATGDTDAADVAGDTDAADVAGDADAADVADDTDAADTDVAPDADAGDTISDGDTTDTNDTGADVVTACEPGVERCAGPQVVARCNEDGGGETLRECPGARYCDDETVTCLDQICEPLSTQCLDGEEAFETCDVRGAGYLASFPCQPDEFCDDGACVPQLCEPDALRCDDDDVLVCDPRGDNESVLEACPFGCADGACRDSRCGDGIVDAENDETCDDGNDTACDGCTTCSLQRTLDIRGLDTTLGAAWVPGESDFTIEAWVDLSGNGTLLGLGATSEDDGVLLEVDAGFVVFSYRTGEDAEVSIRSAERLAAGWHHIAAVRFDRHGAALFVDGLLVSATVQRSDLTSIDGTGAIWLGSDGSGNGVNGHVDAVHISGSARYSTSFTPELRPIEDDATVALYEFDVSNVADAGVDRSPNARTLVLIGATLGVDDCRGAAPSARFCGDGNVAPWERCDGGATCTASCQPELGCGSIVGPEDTCYAFADSAVSWTDARDACRDLGAELVTLDSELENTWVAAVSGISGRRWIGINDRGDEGEYLWVSGVANEYRAWASGQPDNFFFREDCVELLGRGEDDITRWNDLNCGEDRGYVCEFE